MTDPAHIPNLKKALRRQALDARRMAGRDGAAEALAALDLPVAVGAVVAGYWPMAGEMDPRPLMARLAERGAVLALPVVVERDRHLDFRLWAPGDELEPGDHGTFHPSCQAPLVSPTVVLVPLLAFDRRGFRLGYGGGYYDRTLESLRACSQVMTVGIAFADQEVASVPQDERDQRLDWVATERGLIKVEG